MKKILETTKEKINSDAKFHCLQGNLTDGQVIRLLQGLADAKYTFEEMKGMAEEMKLNCNIQMRIAELLHEKDFEAVQANYGSTVFNEERRKIWFASFKAMGKKKEALVPTDFQNYVEAVCWHQEGVQQQILAGL